MAGANQKLKDENNQTPYEVAVAKGNHKVASLLKPIITEEGHDISGIMYARNNPKHPEFRPEGRRAFFNLYAMNLDLSQQNEEEGEEDDEVSTQLDEELEVQDVIEDTNACEEMES